jgi:S-formylglutathione hydrolase FrmB
MAQNPAVPVAPPTDKAVAVPADAATKAVEAVKQEAEVAKPLEVKPAVPTGPVGEKAVTPSPEGCTVEKFAIRSSAMNKDVKVVVILPPEYAANKDKKYPILYTLHGGGGAPYDTYAEMGLLRAALKDKPMIVTCFDANGTTSGYADSPTNPSSQYTTFFFQEFIPYVDAHYRTNGQRGVTGFSMGGGGAFHYMFTHPEMFAGVSALSQGFRKAGPRPSGAPNAAPPAVTDRRPPTGLRGPDSFAAMEKLLAAKAKLPHLFIASGTEDTGALAGTRAYGEFLKQKGVEFEYMESPGAHKWDYWLGMAPTFMDFHWRAFQADYKVMAHPNPAAGKTDETKPTDSKPADAPKATEPKIEEKK